jgi:murein DD-endopeptidase MepM/ murein hydrolase activator NlpD
VIALATVAALVGVFTLAWVNNFGGIREKTAAFWKFVGPLLISFGKSFVNLGTAFGKLFVSLKPVLIAIAFILGGVIAVALPAFLIWIETFINGIALLIDGVAAFIDILFKIGTTLIKIVDIFIHGGSMQDISVAWDKLGDDIVAIIGGWVGDATKIVADFLEGILGLFGTNTADMIKIVGTFVNDTIKWWSDLFDRSVKWFNETFNAIVNVFLALWKELVGASIVPDIVNDVVGWFGKLPKLLQDIAKDIWKKVTDTFTDLKNDALDLFVKLVGTERAGGILQTIYNLKESLTGPRGLITVLIGARGTGGIVGLFWGMVDLVTGKSGAAESLKTMLGNTLTDIKDAAIGPSGLVTLLIGSKEGKNGVVGLFWSIFDAVTNVFGSDDSGNSTVRGFIATAWNGVISFVNSVAENVKKAFLDPIAAVVTGMGGFMDGFAGVIKNGFEGALGVIQAFARAFVDAINMVAKWLTGDNVITWSDDSIPVKLKDANKTAIPDLPKYAKGTGYHPGGYAVVGDDGPEVLKLPLGSRVVPNNLSKRLWRGAGGATAAATAQPYDPNNPDTTPPGVNPIDYFLSTVGAGIRKTISRIEMGAEGLLDSVLGLTGIKFAGVMDTWGPTIFGVVKDMGIDKIGDMIRSWITDHLPGWVATWLYGKTNTESQHRRFANDNRNAPGEIPGVGGGAPIMVSPEGYVFPVRGYHGPIDLHWGSYPGAADIFGAPGADILAMHAGKVTYSGFDSTGGNAVFIVGSDGLKYYYAHMKNQPYPHVGDDVPAGTLLGQLWNTGNASSGKPHLHIGIGHQILLGSGPKGGAGEEGFNARGLLQQVYNFSISVPTPSAPIYGDNYGQPWWGSAKIGAATSQVTDWVRTALTLAKSPADWVTAMTMLVMGESGGKQFAINRDDVNAPAHPSRGIAQVIPDTFNTYKRAVARAFTGPQGYGGEAYEHSDAVGDIYNPIENLLAALGWILRGKGLKSPNDLAGFISGLAGGPWIGYATGGLINEPIVGRGLRTGTNYTFGEVGPELILPVNAQLANLIKGLAVGSNMGPQAMWQNATQMTQPLAGSAQDFSALLSVYAPNVVVQGAGMGPDEAAAVMKRVLTDHQAKFYAQAASKFKQKTGR